jgi:uncharacterized protein
MISIEVVYALPDVQHRVTLTVQEPCTALEALKLSGLQDKFAELAAPELGIYSRPLDGRLNPLPDAYIMRDGDRLEIYRPLQLDPKKARLQRAARNKRRS